ncbi:MAG TPA: hypothetical protein VGI78_08455 [Acetobacteraceae bacterium]
MPGTKRIILTKSVRDIGVERSDCKFLCFPAPPRARETDDHGDVSDATRGHVVTMVQTLYRVFVQQDGNFGVVLSQLGATVRTATGFAAMADAHAWIEQDARLENADNPFRERDPGNPQAH